MSDNDELATLHERVERGMAWLTEHDPTGAFHLWFTAKLHPSSPMPAQDDVRRAEYRAYYEARRLWERLWARMERMERRQEAG